MSSGSQKRKTTARIAINCTPSQKAAIREKTDATGLSPSAMCLAVLLDVPLPKRRRPSVNAQEVARVLAELGKIGSNINQIAYHLNAGRPGDRIEGSLEEALRDLMEMRLACLQALGYERNRRPPGKTDHRDPE